MTEMTREDIIAMALEAEIDFDFIDEDEGQIWYITLRGLERFATLIASRIAAAAKAEEREACALIAETAADCLQNSTFEGVAISIRARSGDKK